MAMRKQRPSGSFIRSGSRLAGLESEWDAAGMPLYKRDRSFSVGWVFGGAVLMIIANLLGGLIAGVLGVRSLAAVVAISVASFVGGGFIIGWKSEGRTILEAGLAAAVATAASIVYRTMFQHVPFMLAPMALIIGCAIPFASGILGGWIGEMVQGQTVDTGD
jgi:hypothetical protein